MQRHHITLAGVAFGSLALILAYSLEQSILRGLHPGPYDFATPIAAADAFTRSLLSQDYKSAAHCVASDAAAKLAPRQIQAIQQQVESQQGRLISISGPISSRLGSHRKPYETVDLRYNGTFSRGSRTGLTITVEDGMGPDRVREFHYDALPTLPHSNK